MYIKKSRLILAVILLIIITSFVTVALVNPFGISNTLDFLKFSQVSGIIENVYYEDTDMSETVNMAIAGVAASKGDPYTNYIWGDMATRYMEEVEGNYCGVGLYIEYDMEENLISVVSAIAGSPAEAAGIGTGDKILKLDGEVYLGSELSEAASYMKGEENTDVVLTIRSAVDGKERDIKLTRSRIEIASVSGKMLSDGIGYISVNQFAENTADKFKEEYNTLSMQNMRALIIDLRNNPGGLLDQAIGMASQFIPEGNLVTYTLDKNEKKQGYFSDNKNVTTELPIVILQNGGSASASEVFTGALKDYGLATVMGEKSYGKGVVQKVFMIDSDEILSVTAARYYTPNGICIHGEGIEPDVMVEMDAEKTAKISYLEIYDDEQLSAAIDYLNT